MIVVVAEQFLKHLVIK